MTNRTGHPAGERTGDSMSTRLDSSCSRSVRFSASEKLVQKEENTGSPKQLEMLSTALKQALPSGPRTALQRPGKGSPKACLSNSGPGCWQQLDIEWLGPLNAYMAQCCSLGRLQLPIGSQDADARIHARQTALHFALPLLC